MNYLLFFHTYFPSYPLLLFSLFFHYLFFSIPISLSFSYYFFLLNIPPYILSNSSQYYFLSLPLTYPILRLNNWLSSLVSYYLLHILLYSAPHPFIFHPPLSHSPSSFCSILLLFMLIKFLTSSNCVCREKITPSLPYLSPPQYFFIPFSLFSLPNVLCISFFQLIYSSTLSISPSLVLFLSLSPRHNIKGGIFFLKTSTTMSSLKCFHNIAWRSPSRHCIRSQKVQNGVFMCLSTSSSFELLSPPSERALPQLILQPPTIFSKVIASRYVLLRDAASHPAEVAVDDGEGWSWMKEKRTCIGWRREPWGNDGCRRICHKRLILSRVSKWTVFVCRLILFGVSFLKKSFLFYLRHYFQQLENIL